MRKHYEPSKTDGAAGGRAKASAQYGTNDLISRNAVWVAKLLDQDARVGVVKCTSTFHTLQLQLLEKANVVLQPACCKIIIKTVRGPAPQGPLVPHLAPPPPTITIKLACL